MDYKGIIQSVPFGDLGVETDFATLAEPPFALLEGENISIRYNQIEKDRGSMLWNTAGVLPAGVVSLFDWWPDDHTQRLIVVCKDGKVYKYTDRYHFVEVTPSGGAPVALNPSAMTWMVQGGNEVAGNPRKLFIFSGNDPVQVITGDAIVRTNMTKPAADWTVGNYPRAGIQYNAQFNVWGNMNRAHTIYQSNPADHEDFQTNGSFTLVDVFPGEGDRLESLFVFKSRLHVTKYPQGFYYLDDTTASTLVFKLGESFGSPSTKCAVQAIDDMLIANTSGSLTSLKAVFALGNMEQGDFMKGQKCLRLLQENTSSDGQGVRQGIYYEDRKQVLYVYRGRSSQMNDKILTIDFHSGQPKVTLNTKDQPTCLALQRDFKRIPRPIYGDDLGNIYTMDSPNRDVGGAGYTGRFRSQYMDFGFVDKRLTEQNKIFDFLELTLVPTGRFPLFADIFVDGRQTETVVFYMNRRNYMSRTFSGKFKLGSVRLRGVGPISLRKQLHTTGRRISVRIYSVEAGHNFIVQQMTFYFRLAGNVQRR